MMKSLGEYLKRLISPKKEQKPQIKNDKRSNRICIQDNRPDDTEKFQIQIRVDKGIKRSQQKIFLQVGIDFGTSATKIAYAIVGERKRVKILRFHHGLAHYPEYCLPSVAALDKSRQLLLGIDAARYLQDKPWNMGLRRFKMLVAKSHEQYQKDKPTPYNQKMIEIAEPSYEQYLSDYSQYLSDNSCEQDQYDPKLLTAVFLAFAMRQARIAVRKKFSTHDVDVAFNICMPIDYLQNNDVKSVYERIIATAGEIESQWSSDDTYSELLELASKTYNNVTYNHDDPQTRVFFIPESVAEAASYLVSLQAHDGKHAVIDFGAGTTDVSIFNLQGVRRSESTSYWYAARNVPVGSQRIEKLVFDFLQKSPVNQSHITEGKITTVLQNLHRQAPELTEKIRQELESLWKSSHSVWGEAYSHLRNQSEWQRDKVHIFVCGGGAKIPSIQEIFSKSWMKDWGPYPIETLPEPDDYDSNNQPPFIRLAVAYGLTIPEPELSKYVLPADVPDHTYPPLPHIKTDYVHGLTDL